MSPRAQDLAARFGAAIEDGAATPLPPDSTTPAAPPPLAARGQRVSLYLPQAEVEQFRAEVGRIADELRIPKHAVAGAIMSAGLHEVARVEDALRGEYGAPTRPGEATR
jgi:hypothetical protein